MEKKVKFNSFKRVLTVIFFIITGSFLPRVMALVPDKTIDSYLVDKWDKAAGLPSNSILSINRTPNGFLWIGTYNGLVRFDGITFSTIPGVKNDEISTRDIRCLSVGSNGHLWIGSASGLAKYNCKEGRYKIFTPAEGITSDGIRCVTEDSNGHYWISFTASCVNRLAKGEFFTFNASNGLMGKKINAIVEYTKGNLLFGTSENGVFAYKDGNFFKYSIRGLESSRINAMKTDRQGNLWIGTNLGLFQVKGKYSRRYTIADGLSDNYISSILEDSEGSLWLGTLNKGINRLKKRKGGQIGFESTLTSYKILCLFEDCEKSLWVGTINSGLLRLKDRKFLFYHPLKSYGDEIVFSIFQDNRGDTWIGTVSGKLFCRRSSGLIQYMDIPGLSGIGIAAIAEDKEGGLWLGTIGKGVYYKKKEDFARFATRDELSDNQVTSIFPDSRGALWFCTFDGVSVRHPDGAIASFKSPSDLPGKKVHNVYEMNNHDIWIASDKGITILKPGLPGTAKNFSAMSYKPVKNILPGVSVTCIHEDLTARDPCESVVWIATNGTGLIRLCLKEGKETNYTKIKGISTDIIYQFSEDRRGNFWLMSDSGILLLNKSELNLFAQGGLDEINCVSFGPADSLEGFEFGNEFSGNSLLKTQSGEFWFITRKGISIMNPQKILFNETPPPVIIERISFKKQFVFMPRKTKPYTFKGSGDFSALFTAPTFLSPEKVIFKYTLEGYETGWNTLHAGKDRAVSYRELHPGTYVFRVIARNAEGFWNKTGASVMFRLQPFFYQTPLFKIVVLFLALSILIAVLYIYREHIAEKRKKYKTSSLNSQYARECIKKLEHLMESDKIYRDTEISLRILAKQISIKPYLLSQIINEHLKKNFYDFINSYRIEEAKQILASPGRSKRNIDLLTGDVGFKTKAAFYKAFKKYTGKTPKQYKKQVLNKS